MGPTQKEQEDSLTEQDRLDELKLRRLTLRRAQLQAELEEQDKRAMASNKLAASGAQAVADTQAGILDSLGSGASMAGKILDTPAGVVRSGIAKGLEELTGKELIDANEVLMNAPDFSEIMSRGDVLKDSPIIRGVSGFAADVATDPLTYIPGVNLFTVPYNAAKFLMKPVAAGAKLGTKAAKSVARAAAQMDEKMAESFLRDRGTVAKWEDLIRGRGNEARNLDEATRVINKNRDALREFGINQFENDLLSKLAGGKTVQVNTSDLKALADLGVPGAQEALTKAEIARKAQRPFERGVETASQVQEGMSIKPTVSLSEEGIKVDNLLTPDPGQGSLFGEEWLGQYTAPRKPAPVSDVFNKEPSLSQAAQFNEALDAAKKINFAKMMSEAPQSSLELGATQKSTIQDLLRNRPEVAPNTEVFSSAYFNPQEVLDLPMRQAPEGKMILDALEAQKLKKQAQEIADYDKLSSNELLAGIKAQAKQEEAGNVASNLQKAIESLDPSIAPTNRDLQLGLELQKELKRGQKNPIAFLKSATDDTLGRMRRVADRVGDEDLINEGLALRTAKVIAPVDVDDALRRQAARSLGRASLKGIDYAERGSNAVRGALEMALDQAGPISPQVWAKILKDEQERAK